MNTLYASAGTIDKIQSLISRFYGGSTISLIESGEVWTVHNRNGEIPGVRVVLKRGRYRFERIAD